MRTAWVGLLYSRSEALGDLLACLNNYSFTLKKMSNLNKYRDMGFKKLYHSLVNKIALKGNRSIYYC